jgi:apolipoprotein N-acyltransferase
MKDEASAAVPAADVVLLSPSPFPHRPASFVLSFALGALCVAGFAPLAWFPLPIVALAGLMLIWCATPTRKAAALHGFCFGLGLFLFGVSWVYISLAEFGGMPAPIAALATLLFCVILALYPAGVGYVQQRLAGGNLTRNLFLIPALWTLAEWLRDAVTGFPWLAFGYAQIAGGPLAAFAPVAGVFGVSLACALVSGILAVCVAHAIDAIRSYRTGAAGVSGRIWRAGAVALLAVLALGASASALQRIEWSEPAGPPLKVALLQGNVAQNLKFEDAWYDSTLASYRRLALASDATLVVWPETAIPRLLDQVDEDFLEDLRISAAAHRADMLIGMPYRDAAGNFYNSVVSFGASPTQLYSKSHLVPFGEFIPAGFHWLLAVLHIPLGDFARGSTQPQPLSVAGQRVAVDICYEDAFGEEIIRQLPGATLLVNVSNVAWFGHSIAPMQHLQMSQMRALETGRPMLRATNTGMTAVIDAHGAVGQVLPQYTEGALIAMVQPQRGITPFVRWGNASALIAACVLLAIGLAISRFHRASPGDSG